MPPPQYPTFRQTCCSRPHGPGPLRACAATNPHRAAVSFAGPHRAAVSFAGPHRAAGAITRIHRRGRRAGRTTSTAPSSSIGFLGSGDLKHFFLVCRRSLVVEATSRSPHRQQSKILPFPSQAPRSHPSQSPVEARRAD